MTSLSSRFILFVFLALSCSGVRGSDRLLPKLVCDVDTFDFGERRDTETFEHEFRIRNEGRAPLVIQRVHASCGCTTSRVSTNTVYPGKSAMIKARVSLRGRSGKLRKSLTVHSNDPVHPRHRLWVMGTVMKELEFSPPILNLGSLEKMTVVTNEVKFVCRVPGVVITGASSGRPEIGVSVAPTRDRLLVFTKPPIRTGALRDSIKVRTTHKKKPLLNYPVVATVMGEVTVVPRSIIVREGKKESVTRAVLIKPAARNQYKILRVQVPLPEITYKVLRINDGTYRIDFRHIPVKQEVDRKVIQVFTDLDEMKEIRIPIRMLPKK